MNATTNDYVLGSGAGAVVVFAVVVVVFAVVVVVFAVAVVVVVVVVVVVGQADLMMPWRRDLSLLKSGLVK